MTHHKSYLESSGGYKEGVSCRDLWEIPSKQEEMQRIFSAIPVLFTVEMGKSSPSTLHDESESRKLARAIAYQSADFRASISPVKLVLHIVCGSH